MHIKWMMPSALVSILGVYTLMPPQVADASTWAQKTTSIQINGQAVAHPIHLIAADPWNHQNTSWLPIFYLDQAMTDLQINASWNGNEDQWNLITSAQDHLNTTNLPKKQSLNTEKIAIQINHTTVLYAPRLVAIDPNSNQKTTFVPSWYVMSALNRLGIRSDWSNGQNWNMVLPSNMTNTANQSFTSSQHIASPLAVNTLSKISSTQPFTQSTTQSIPPTSSVFLQPDSGVSNGIHITGTDLQQWFYTASTSIQMKNDVYTNGSNLLPIQGTDGSYTGDLVVQIIPINSANPDNVSSISWDYSIPVLKGQFASTVTIPYSGEMDVNVFPVYAPVGGDFSTPDTFAYTNINNSEPTLTDTQMALLQSWMVNYNESINIQQKAQSIVNPILSSSSTDKRYQEIKAISDWVSQHIQYNWPAFEHNQIPWQQASETYQSSIGVCQDESALAAAMLRSLGIPTRVMDGTAVLSGATGPHQWDESWDGNRWVVYDPTLDQVYYSNQVQSISLPANVTDTNFDAPTQIFDQSHQDIEIGQW